MSEERFTEILEKDYPFYKNGDGILEGLLIIKKYLPDKRCIQAAEHDVIYACDVDEICELITEDDAIKLGEFNWGVDVDVVFHFV